jgi:hypothetical protein
VRRQDTHADDPGVGCHRLVTEDKHRPSLDKDIGSIGMDSNSQRGPSLDWFILRTVIAAGTNGFK